MIILMGLVLILGAIFFIKIVQCITGWLTDLATCATVFIFLSGFFDTNGGFLCIGSANNRPRGAAAPARCE